jgi:hypothetical protein
MRVVFLLVFRLAGLSEVIIGPLREFVKNQSPATTAATIFIGAWIVLEFIEAIVTTVEHIRKHIKKIQRKNLRRKRRKQAQALNKVAKKPPSPPPAEPSNDPQPPTTGAAAPGEKREYKDAA